jgi:hypothetical protein
LTGFYGEKNFSGIRNLHPKKYPHYFAASLRTTCPGRRKDLFIKNIYKKS